MNEKKSHKGITFDHSSEFWEKAYADGRRSGSGSYGRLADFKAEIINAFIENNNINSAIEFGCGDGNQLSLIRYPNYIGLDVSKSVIDLCKSKFKGDKSKSFYRYESESFGENLARFSSDMSVSLDVIFHLIEDDVYEHYMTHLFASAKRFVIIYSSNLEKASLAHHVRLREFTSWVSSNCPDWELVEKIKNRYPKSKDRKLETSACDFYIYKRR